MKVKNNMNGLIMVVIFAFIIVAFGYLIFERDNYWQEKFTIRANYDFFQNISNNQKFDIYRDRMEKFRIAYSPVYKFRGKKSGLSNEEFERFCRLTYRIETTVNFPLGTFLSLGIVETDLRGSRTGLYNEKGLLQIMASNVDFINYLWKKYQNQLPSWLNPLLNDSDDFFDMEKVVRSATLILYHGRIIYKNDWKWIITDYHYGGGYTSRHWVMPESGGELPLIITLNEIEYIVTDYWMMWKTLQESFMNNNINAGDEKIKEIVRTKKKRLSKSRLELKQYFSVKKTLQKFERQAENNDQRINDALKENKDLQNRVKKALQIAETAYKTKKYKHFKSLLQKIKNALYEKK